VDPDLDPNPAVFDIDLQDANKKPGFRIRTGSGFNQVSGSGSGFGIRIKEGKNYQQK
jgi:hypothetical protein